ncbi:MAG: N-acetyltransferase [Methylobacteriaceae bacterium]|nr:N-acetyltransferase [Methylobacteriaceae bacterium]
MIIRKEKPSDVADIRAVVQAAFLRAAEANLVDRLRADDIETISLVATADDRVVGHIMMSQMGAPFRALGLAPVSVLPDRQHEGIGSRLIRVALSRASKEGWDCVFVVGAPRFYERFGFRSALAAGFTSRFAGGNFMALALSGPLPVASGQIDYAPAFADL